MHFCFFVARLCVFFFPLTTGRHSTQKQWLPPTWKPSSCLTRKLIQDSQERGATCKIKTWLGFNSVLAELFWSKRRKQRIHRQRRSRSVTRGLWEGILCCLTRENRGLCPGARVQGVMDAFCMETQTFLSRSLAAAGPCDMTGSEKPGLLFSVASGSSDIRVDGHGRLLRGKFYVLIVFY